MKYKQLIDHSLSYQMLAQELIEIKKKKVYLEINPQITPQLLQDILLGNSTGAVAAQGSQKQGEMSLSRSTNGSTTSTPLSTTNKAPTADVKRLKEINEKLEEQYFELKHRLNDAEFEMQRLTEQLKFARQDNSEIAERFYFAESERDFFKLKWSEACPQESQLLDKLSLSVTSSLNGQVNNPFTSQSETAGDSELTSSTSTPRAPPLQEKVEYTTIVVKYLREIDDLKRQLAAERSGNIAQLENLQSTELMLPAEIDTEFTSAISSLIAQTRTQLMEESRKLHSALHESTDDDYDLSEEKASATHLLDDVEEEEKAFNKRQRLLTAEVAEIGQSIQLKEQLMAQLIKSQQQYSVMKSFYEQKLSVLSLAMQEKQAEREKLLAELSEISEKSKSNQTTVVQERESKLREDLKLKDEELSKMKKKQDELRNLTQLQSQYSRQMAKLESEIVGMKRQRVDLTKTLQQEKKNYMLNLSEKAKEIERLKKELNKASSEVKKLGRSKEIAETKAKDALREGAALKKKTQELMKFHVDVTSTSAARAAIRAISKASSKFASSKYLSEEELSVKRWIDKRISEISAREAAAEALKRQCEQQLELLQRRELLENERQIAISKVANQEAAEMAHSDSYPPSTPNAKQSSHEESQMPSTPIFTSSEEEKLLELIEDRLSSIDGQLNARNQKISDIRRKISEAGDIHGSEKAVEFLLKKISAGSLPAAHELIRMLFDMLIHVSKEFKIHSEQANELLEKERLHMQRIDDLQNKLAAEKRAHDMELTTINKEFEQKLQGFFHHIIPDSNSSHANVDSDSDEEDEFGFAKVRSHSRQPSQRMDFGSPSGKILRRTASFDTTAIQLALTTEEGKLLKSQLEREQIKTSQYEPKVSELEKIKFSLMMDVEDKNSQIKFLEEDRELFKKMAEELKAALNSLGKDGKTMVLNATHRVSGRPMQGLFGEYLDSSEEEDETESVQGEFDNIAEEIHRTGGISNTRASSILNESSGRGGGGSHADIFHRLHNPSNYTGHMRSIFKDNLAKRKGHEKQVHHGTETVKKPTNSTSTATASTHGHKKEKDHTAAVAVGVNAHHPYYSFSTTLPPWKKTNAGGSEVGMQEESNDPQSSSSSALSIDVVEGENTDTTSPEPVPNVFSRLTTRMTGIHKHRPDMAPRTISPSSANTAMMTALRPTSSETSHENQRLARTSSSTNMTSRSVSMPSTPSASSSSNGAGSGANNASNASRPSTSGQQSSSSHSSSPDS